MNKLPPKKEKLYVKPEAEIQVFESDGDVCNLSCGDNEFNVNGWDSQGE